MRYAALISYDGTEFAGWQRQKNAVSVQEVLENALKTAFHKEITVTASGRTDAGVHAEGQVCHFDADLTLPADKFPEAVNRFLPDGVSLLKSAAAKDGFDANRTAKRKTYRYSFYVYPQKLPLKERYSLRLDAAPPIGKLCRAAAMMEGEHDFKAFCAANSSVKTTVRTVYEARAEEKESVFAGEKIREIDFYVTGNGFLYNMVRLMTGTLLRVGRGELPPEAVTDILASGERWQAGPMAPACGLCMMGVEYR